ncbi:unnamed protein product [Closterium sp. NIES-53]
MIFKHTHFCDAVLSFPPAAALLRHEDTLACALPPSTSAFSPTSVARVANRNASARRCRTATVLAAAGSAAATSGDESEGGGRAGRRAAIDVEGLSLSLGRAQVLRECSLRVPEGQLWMLLGPNGCGKSTLLKVGERVNAGQGGRESQRWSRYE